MSKSPSIKTSGWAFILGALAFMGILTRSDAFAIPGSMISSILVAVGVLGLRGRYGENAGPFGRNILLIGVIGMLVLYLVIVSMAFLYFSGAQLAFDQAMANGLWILIFGGPAVLLLALTLFGLAALRSKPMPHANWLPLVAGIWYPLAYFFLTGYLFTHDGVIPWEYYPALETMFLIQGLALCVLGFVLVADAPKEIGLA